MPRLSYAAPGVYVEEIPSAQQPIAGVGTNTVGFIGAVPDVVQIPVPNQDYDPVLAQLVLKVNDIKTKGDDTAKEDTDTLKNRIQDLKGKNIELGKVKDEKNDELVKNQGDLDSAKTVIADLESKPDDDADRKANLGPRKNEQKRYSKAVADLGREVEEIQKQIDLNQATMDAMQNTLDGKAPSTEPKKTSALCPYMLKPFTVQAKALETRLCTNFSEYTTLFGSFSAYSDDDPEKPMSPGHQALTHAVFGFFQNGGTRCFVARVTEPPDGKELPDLEAAVEKFESIEAVAIVAAPGRCDADTWDYLTAHCDICENRFAILDCCETPTADSSNPDVFDITVLNYDSPDYLDFLPQRDKNAAFYFPWIEVSDPAKKLQDQDPARQVPMKYQGRVYVPPSGHVAGIYARTDEQRGVHKAPANEPVIGALNVRHYISKPKQELLNPQGVNVIRNLNGNITVWGARTVGGDLNTEWKYINVRRLFLFLRDSIDHGTQWVVFEPNDRALWEKIRRNVSDFLRIVWRSGALFGSSPEEAYYVKCDDETNPPEERELGKVITEIGVAIVRPAEFVIFRITQTSGAKAS